jgi:hypothetical protein
VSGHTAGPWAIHYQRRVIVPLGDAFKPIEVKDGVAHADEGAQSLFLIADPRDGLSEDETYANAFLAAAAPCLLEALEEAVEWDSHDAEGVEAVWLAKARAAIAKAKGQAQ